MLKFKVIVLKVHPFSGFDLCFFVGIQIRVSLIDDKKWVFFKLGNGGEEIRDLVLWILVFKFAGVNLVWIFPRFTANLYLIRKIPYFFPFWITDIGKTNWEIFWYL